MSRSDQYREQVERIDRRRRWLIRSGAFAGSALLASVALWNAGVNPTDWYRWLHQHSNSAKRMEVRVPNPIPHAALPLSPSQASLKPLPGTDSSISLTPQGLVLTGTVPGRNFKEGYAMLGVARENPQTYAAGALLANGARLVEIHPKYVVLQRGAYSATLYLDGSGHDQTDRQTTNALLSVGGAERIKAAVATSYEVITDYLRPTPVYDGQVLRGYEVYPGVKGAVFSQTGLQPGDVITTIDGAPVSDTNQTVETLHQLLDGAALSLTVERKGKVVSLTLNGELIVKDQEQAMQAVAALTASTGVPGTP